MSFSSSMDMGWPQISFNDLRVTLNVGWSASRNDVAVVQNGNPVRYGHHEVHVMFDQQDGNARMPERVYQVDKLRYFFLHKTGRGFVKQQQPWPRRECPGNLQKSAMPVRKRTRWGITEG